MLDLVYMKLELMGLAFLKLVERLPHSKPDGFRKGMWGGFAEPTSALNETESCAGAAKTVCSCLRI